VGCNARKTNKQLGEGKFSMRSHSLWDMYVGGGGLEVTN
jgi:hypothetical protein